MMNSARYRKINTSNAALPEESAWGVRKIKNIRISCLLSLTVNQLVSMISNWWRACFDWVQQICPQSPSSFRRLKMFLTLHLRVSPFTVKIKLHFFFKRKILPFDNPVSVWYLYRKCKIGSVKKPCPFCTLALYRDPVKFYVEMVCLKFTKGKVGDFPRDCAWSHV